MDHIINLDREQEAALTEHAQRFVRDQHKGNTMQALKAMMLLNGQLQERLDALAGELKYPGSPEAKPCSPPGLSR